MTAETRTAEARAKINPFLRILGRRADGYHEIETLILPISLADRVTVHAAAGDEFRTLSVELAVTGDPAAVAGVPVDESNLVMRAAVLLASRAGLRGFAEVALEKHVPVGGGLGGGSADAAATLRLLNEVWGSPFDPAGLSDMAAELGSDVPALLTRGPALARGRGEVVEPAARGGPLSWVLQTFSFGISTRDAYAWWDEDPEEPMADATALTRALAADVPDPSVVGPLLHNDFDGPVLRRHEPIRRVLELLRRSGTTGAVLCGSGSSVVGLLPAGADRLDPDAERALQEIAGRPPVVVTSGT